VENVAKFSKKRREELFRLTASKKGIIESLVEKDFWVSLVLKSIFESEKLKDILIFKGGTSLSKVYNLIRRFSEDIDLILDWRTLNISDEKAWEERSATQQDKFNLHIDTLGKDYVANEILPVLENILLSKADPPLQLTIPEHEPHVIQIQYPVSFNNNYLLNFIKLEIGPRSSRVPCEHAQISCYAANEYPQLFKASSFPVKVIKPERTFWEKVTILHQIACVSEDKSISSRYSRHYYDIYQMNNSAVKAISLSNLKLLQEVAEFKNRFYRSPSARYDLAKSGTLKIIPSENKILLLKKDYEQMKEMLFGEIPTFEEIIGNLKNLEEEINTPGKIQIRQ
jgi:predicted nucleotidyltransferase component of viral defense system